MDFALKHFKHVVYLDFREHPDYKKFFTPNLEVDSIIMRITAAMPSVEIEAGETCFIFDEIQDCPKARGALKYFHLDGRYEVMCTGSLLGVNGYKTPEEKKEEGNAETSQAEAAPVSETPAFSSESAKAESSADYSADDSEDDI